MAGKYPGGIVKTKLDGRQSDRDYSPARLKIKNQTRGPFLYYQGPPLRRLCAYKNGKSSTTTHDGFTVPPPLMFAPDPFHWTQLRTSARSPFGNNRGAEQKEKGPFSMAGELASVPEPTALYL